MPEKPFADTRDNVSRAAGLMADFAREMQEEIDKERGELRRVHGREAQE